MSRYLYVVPALQRSGFVESDQLDTAVERHNVGLQPVQVRVHAAAIDFSVLNQDVRGVVLEPRIGILGRTELRAAGRVLRAGLPLWLYFPSERTVERVDDERLRSLWRHAAAHAAFRLQIVASRPFEALARVPDAFGWAYRQYFRPRRREVLDTLAGHLEVAKPVPFRNPTLQPTGMCGSGVYLRCDYWNRVTSGGSYGHTCYVARYLQQTSRDLVCLLPNRYPLLDDLGVRQVFLDAPTRDGEDAMVLATAHYYPILKSACQVLSPAYIYERLCLGNYAAAKVSRDLQIPYIVEYNGSELSIQKSFDDGTAHRYHDIYVEAEALAFRQATCISVVSQLIKDDLVRRGVDARKILVNPNGADLDSYAPADPADRARIRAELGFRDEDRIIGFTATFGGWHATDVIAAAIPRICAASERNQFVLIGDGVHRELVDRVVDEHHLDDRVRIVGRVAQAEGARLMKACDLFVAPHNAHMVDSRFFGSPTKVFEYMALGGGIVASSLEQMGEVLSPALTVGDLRRQPVLVRDERAVLCRPGDVDEFAEAVTLLADRPDISRALGRNARQAVADHYSWRRHVERLWQFAAELESDRVDRIQTGEVHKDEIQRQWNGSPVGSERARGSQPHTLDWFREIEADRYGRYAPWMPTVMEFSSHSGEQVLEIGGGLGIDLAQFASHGAHVTDLDLSAGHLALAQEHFRLRRLCGRFVHHDGEALPFPDESFDLVYTNGVIHHTPNARRMVDEIYRVLRPGGRCIAMVYAENSLYYWRNLVYRRGVRERQLGAFSMGDIMSRSVEASGTDARPLVKVYTRARLARLFKRFSDVAITQRQLRPDELSRPLRPFRPLIERAAGWNLIVKAARPR